jgi:hypothetical protein
VKGERKVRPRYFIGLVIGASVGMILVYFGIGSISGISLLVGAFIGALVGLRIASAAKGLSSGTFGEKCGMG